MYDAESETCCAQTKTIMDRNNNYTKNDDDDWALIFYKIYRYKRAKSNCILKVHDYLFNFILNINQIQDHQRTILDIQTWYIFLSNKF